jgi:hypothetical protein
MPIYNERDMMRPVVARAGRPAAASTISFGSAAMRNAMARSAQRNQVLFRIIARMATKLFVVDFQVQH